MKSSVFVVKTYCFLHVTTNYLCFPTYCYGPSMIPTLDPSGNVLLAERVSMQRVRGDIVVLQSLEDPNKTPFKRVVGLEGDCISFVVDSWKKEKSKTIVVPKGHVWVQGDYTQKSKLERLESLYELIQGKVLWRILDRLDRPRLEIYTVSAGQELAWSFGR